jgi:hypothetical protein
MVKGYDGNLQCRVTTVVHGADCDSNPRMSTKFWKIELLGVLPLRPSAIMQACVDHLHLHSYPGVIGISCGPGPFQAPQATCTIHNSSDPSGQTVCSIHKNLQESIRSTRIHRNPQKSTGIHKNPQESTGIQKSTDLRPRSLPRVKKLLDFLMFFLM